MNTALAIDWHAVFVPALGLAEVVVRGSIIYLALFVILRFVARRQAGHFGPADLLVVVIIADAAQNGFGKDYTSVTEAIALVLTIVAWERVIDWLAWRVPALRPIFNVPALTLIENGRVVEVNMRKEMLTEDELIGELRQEGVESIGDVRIARLEGSGRVSVFTRDRQPVS